MRNKYCNCINDKFTKLVDKINQSYELFFETKPQFSNEYENYLKIYMNDLEYKKFVCNNYFSSLELPIKVKAKFVFAWIHWNLNALLLEMNNRIQKNSEGHYCANESRELLSIINDIKDLKEVKINVDKQYISNIQKINFLKQTGGSTIPKNIEKFDIKKYEPIFLCDDNSIASEDTIKVIEDIFLSSNNYNAFTDEEKIRCLNECIENLLKDAKGKFKEIDKNMFFGLISNDNCIKYRKETHIFRHPTNENIKKRKKLKSYEKKFLVNYGEIIINWIIESQKYENEH